jgi:hypothetical protein
MSAKFIHMSSRSLEFAVTAIIVYWIALGVAALIAERSLCANCF